MTENHRIGLPVLALIVAALAGVSSLMGIAARGDGSSVLVTSVRGETYAMATSGVYAFNAERIVAEGIGWDVFTLLMAVPLLVVTTVGLHRGSVTARLLATGLFAYFAYMYLEYAVTWAFGPLFLLWVVVLVAALLGLAWAGAAMAGSHDVERFTGTFPTRSWAVLSIGLAVLLTGLWVQRITTALTSEPPELFGATTMTVQALDLGIVIPVSLLLGAAVLRHRPLGRLLSAAWVVTYVAMCLAIASMLVSSWTAGHALEVMPLAVFAVAAVGGCVVGARMYRAMTERLPPSSDIRATAHSQPAIG